MTEYLEKMKSIGFIGKVRDSIRKPVTDETDGSVAGYHTEYRDGRQAATVVLKEPIRLGAKVRKVSEG